MSSYVEGVSLKWGTMTRVCGYCYFGLMIIEVVFDMDWEILKVD